MKLSLYVTIKQFWSPNLFNLAGLPNRLQNYHHAYSLNNR